MKYGSRKSSEAFRERRVIAGIIARFSTHLVRRLSVPRLSLAAITIAGLAGEIHSQQPSQSKPKPLDPATYQTVDECVALKLRLQDSVNRMGMVRDTVPWTIAEQREPLLPVMIQAVARCGEKFRPESTAIKDWALAIQIFLVAGRDNDVMPLIDRRVAAITSNTKADTKVDAKSAQREHARVLDSAVRILLVETQPPRFRLADSLMTVLASFPSEAEGWSERIKRSSMFFDVARVHEEPVYAKRYAQAVYDIGSKLTDADRRTMAFTDTARGLIFFALEHISRDSSLDSLRHGTLSGYFALKRKNFSKATQEALDAFPFPWGNEAPPLRGRWFNGEGKLVEHAAPRPTKGKVSLLVFYGMEYCWAGNRCLGSYAVLRRLKQRFPDLEINVIADHPPAWFGPRTKTDPNEEGAIWGQWLIGYHRIPGEVVLESPGYWRIPGLDRRAIMNRIENPAAYRGKIPLQGRSMATMEGFLVDQTGYIVDWIPQGLTRTYEPTLTELIDILMKRTVSSTNTTATP